MYYTLWVGLWASLGACLGTIINWIYIRISGRQTIITWMLVAMYAIQVLAIPTVGWVQLAKDIKLGVEISKASSFCPA